MCSASLSRNVTNGLPRTTTPLLIHQQRSLASTPLLPSLSYLFLLLFCCLIQAIEKEEEEEEEELHLCAPPIIIQMRERERLLSFLLVDLVEWFSPPHDSSDVGDDRPSPFFQFKTFSRSYSFWFFLFACSLLVLLCTNGSSSSSSSCLVVRTCSQVKTHTHTLRGLKNQTKEARSSRDGKSPSSFLLFRSVPSPQLKTISINN